MPFSREKLVLRGVATFIHAIPINLFRFTAVVRKQPCVSDRDEECLDPPLALPKRPAGKSRAFIIEPDSEGNKDDGVNLGEICDASRAEKRKKRNNEGKIAHCLIRC